MRPFTKRDAPELYKGRKEQIIRLGQCNALLRMMDSLGPGWFYCPERYGHAYFSMRVNGHVYYHDHYSGKAMYAHVRYLYHGFTGGGTLNALITSLVKYIKRGTPLWTVFGPYERWIMSNQSDWGSLTDTNIILDWCINEGIVDADVLHSMDVRKLSPEHRRYYEPRVQPYSCNECYYRQLSFNDDGSSKYICGKPVPPEEDPERTANRIKRYGFDVPYWRNATVPEQCPLPAGEPRDDIWKGKGGENT